jgi:hypothetical protein
VPGYDTLIRKLPELALDDIYVKLYTTGLRDLAEAYFVATVAPTSDDYLYDGLICNLMTGVV